MKKRVIFKPNILKDRTFWFMSLKKGSTGLNEEWKVVHCSGKRGMIEDVTMDQKGGDGAWNMSQVEGVSWSSAVKMVLITIDYLCSLKQEKSFWMLRTSFQSSLGWKSVSFWVFFTSEVKIIWATSLNSLCRLDLTKFDAANDCGTSVSVSMHCKSKRQQLWPQLRSTSRGPQGNNN